MGVDIVDVERFRGIVDRSPGVLDRTLTAPERRLPDGRERSVESLAARFAAKEAVAKALSAPPGWSWLDCEIATTPDGAPVITLSGALAQAAADRGAERWSVSLSHDGGMAIAFVVASGA